MSTVGLITEYNPFHMGHKYHIEQSKKLTGATNTLVIMSGNYVQRGTPAFMDKHTRAKIALKNGADVILELPVPFCCTSAEYFALSAITLLNKTGVVDYLCFGCEIDNLQLLNEIATVLVDAKNLSIHPLNDLIKKHLKQGLSYATARSNGLCEFFEKNININEIINQPNNILAIEYLKALIITGSSIKPVPLKRTVSSYHDNNDNDSMYSASSLRGTINKNMSDLSSKALDQLFEFDNLYKDNLLESYPIMERDYNSILGEKLLFCKLNNIDFSSYNGIDNDLSNRILNTLDNNPFYDWNSFVEAIKTKNIAYTTISRALLSILLDIKKTDFEAYLNNKISSYIRILGFHKEASPILNQIKKHNKISLIGQLSELNSNPNLILNATDKSMIDKSIYCDELYNTIIRTKYGSNIQNEFKKRLLIL